MMRNKRFRTMLGFWLAILLSALLLPAFAVTPSQIPLNVGISAAKPNIMLMIDNSGSMSSTVTSTVPGLLPDDKPSTYKYNCRTAVAGNQTMIINSTGAARFCKSSSLCSSSQQIAFSSSKCFKNTNTYTITYYNTATTLGPYTGAQLNWYFNNSNFAVGSLTAISTTISNSRMSIVKQAATDLVDSLTPEPGESPTVRMGLANYNTDNGGLLMSEIKNLDSTQSTALNTIINGLSPGGTTPLAETLSDIGKYFTTGESPTQTLTLHPNATTPTTASINTIFSKADGSTPHSINNATGNATLAEPILGYCQKSFAILMSDGLPSTDREISPSLRDYTGDCAIRNQCNSTPNTLSLAGINTPLTATGSLCGSGFPTQWNNIACQNGTKAGRTYEPSGGSDYLDDVAQALYEMDLRPTLDTVKKTKTRLKNNLVTYAVGVADPSLQQDSVLKDAAAKAGGKFYFASDSKTLAAALADTIVDIASKISSSASVVANTGSLNTDTAIYQGKFDSGDWSGSLRMFQIGASEDANGNGKLDTGEDTNNNGKLDGGAISATPTWDAAYNIPAFDAANPTSGRNIFTYKVDPAAIAPAPTRTGTTFTCATLSPSQKTALGILDCSNTADKGLWRVNYLRGDWSHEEINTQRTDTDNIRPTLASGNGIFRNRTHVNLDHQQIGPDPWLLGDIVNSNPIFVSNEDYRYGKLPAADGGDGGSTPLYKNFVTSKASRKKMIYVGANDGMLHGFDASATGTDAGKEIFAYIPNEVYDQLNLLTTPDYVHKYSVDGAPRVADAYIGSAWHTLLVGTTGAGGKAVFALDITDPSNFSSSNVLWELSDSQSPTAADLTTDTTTLRGFANNLGYTLPQPSIVKMKDGSWAAVVANGYDSVNNLAVLYIINVQTGAIIRAIDTKAGSSTSPNGLSTPIAVDTDKDRIVDTIYAGDLLGNLWKFDVSSTTPSDWKVAYGTTSAPAPLFVACSDTSACDTTRQPITGKPQVGPPGVTQSNTGIMVYFGTGKYFEDIDNLVANAQTQSFYGIWDNNATVTKTNLQVQSITAEATEGIKLRTTTNTAVDYATKKGWYMNLLKPSATTSDGERVVSFPLLRGSRILFNTLIPIPPAGGAICGESSEGTSWLMEIDAVTGSRLAATTLDISGDGQIDNNDLLNGNSVSGIQSNVGITGTPAIITNGKIEYRYLSGSHDAGMDKQAASVDPSSTTGTRASWRQLE